MKIGISTDSGHVAAHFGRCPEFTIVEIDDNKVVDKEVISNPGHAMGTIPKFLNDHNVECVISGGMGRRAISFFEEYGIKTIVGITGRVDETIDKLIKGELKGGESLCKPRSGHGYGIARSDVDHKHH